MEKLVFDIQSTNPCIFLQPISYLSQSFHLEFILLNTFVQLFQIQNWSKFSWTSQLGNGKITGNILTKTWSGFNHGMLGLKVKGLLNQNIMGWANSLGIGGNLTLPWKVFKGYFITSFNDIANPVV